MHYEESDRPRKHPVLYYLIPASVAVAILLAAIAMAAWGPVQAMTGLGFLVVIPAALGALVALPLGSGGRFPAGGCLTAPFALLIVAALGATFLDESLVCVAMVSAVWLVAGLGGGAVALWFSWQRKRWDQGKSAFYAVGLPALAVSLLLLPSEPMDDWRTVTRSIELDATPEQVWPTLLSIDRIQPAEGRWNFSQNVFGIARPTSARLAHVDGRLVRQAHWGQDIRFEEEITALKLNREIQWRFRFPDQSINLHTDRHIHPDSELLSIHSGGYRLQPLKTGGTRVVLWTRYRQRVGIPWYTASWGERFLGDIQTNVLAIIEGRVAGRRS